MHLACQPHLHISLYHSTQTLAEQLGICDDIAHEKAAYWCSLSLPMAAYFECARTASAPYVMFKPGARAKEVCLQMCLPSQIMLLRLDWLEAWLREGEAQHWTHG